MHFFSPDSSDFYGFVEAAKMNYSPIRSSLISMQNLFEDSCTLVIIIILVLLQEPA